MDKFYHPFLYMQKYDPKKIEKKWQTYWAKNKTFEAREDGLNPEGTPLGEKFYSLIEFPYPSGEGLHVGHPRPFTAMDVISRKKRMEGKNVLFPIGFDAFGLPTENFAIKTGKPPAEVTKKNIANFTRQLKMLGFSFDWSRQVDTTDPNYYKWTQKLFLQFFKHGLAYKKNQPINWCPKDKIGLANEEVVAGCCERCGTAVEKRNKEQWMLAITKYADKLLEGLKNVDYIERARASQENWIGKSEGAEVNFSLRMVPGQMDDKHFVKVFTTRPDTIFGATFLAISPELAKSWVDVGWQAGEEVKKYIADALEARTAVTTREEQEKTGVDAGIVAINPVSKKEIPVWITNYVMGEVGTGAIMGVPAHDQRDFDFAKKFGLPIKKVVNGGVEKTKHLIFDFDGVIGDTYEACAKAQMVIDNKSKEEAIEAMTMYFSSKPNHAKGHSLTEAEVVAKLDWTRRFGEEMAKLEYSLFNNFNEEIKNIPNTKVAIISAGSGLYIRDRIEETGLNPTHVLTYEDYNSKEEKIEQVCKDWGMSMKDVYYFTDSKADVYELEGCLDRKKIIGCSWGYCGYDLLRELLPENQVLKNPEDIQGLFADSVYENEGVAVESDFLNGLNTPEAKSKMIAWLEENGIGKKQINFKLRDWVFSRQRYWGEPIPLVYCENCKDKKYNVVLLHGFSGSVQKGFFPWLKQSLEEGGHKVSAPELPNSANANVEEQVQFVLDNFTFDENTILLGHSLGGVVAMKVLERIKTKIHQLVLVDSFISPGPDRAYASTTTWEFDFDKIRNCAEQITMLVDSTHAVVSADRQNGMREGLQGSVVVRTPVDKHFFASREPEVLQLFEQTGWVPLPEDKLPLKLPKVEKYQPTDNGESPLAAMTSWVKTKCPNCGGPARRETDTMPNWAGSSWYFLAYAMGGEKRLKEKGDKFWDKEMLKHWQPVDWYNGGMEHTVLHLLYSRFWNQFLYDIGMVPTPEPYAKRTSHGMILAKGGEKMSKSKGNVVNPDEMVEQFGADTLRTYIMFMGPFDQAVEWDTNGLVGVKRFLDKVWNLQEKVKEKSQKNTTVSLVAKVIKKVGEDMNAMKFNTAVSALMEFVNELSKEEEIDVQTYKNLIKLVSPFAPHLAEDLWGKFGDKEALAFSSWPTYMAEDLVEDQVTLAVQVNGKLRDTITVAADISEEEAKKIVLASEKIQKWLEGKEPKKVIYVKGKLVSIVV